MSVWPDTFSTNTSLSGNEGVLVSISIAVDARDLESLLETLANLDFPINPQIYHDGAVVYVYEGGAEQAEPATLVEFPAYAERLAEVQAALRAGGFNPSALAVTPMLDEIHSGSGVEPAPPGATWRFRYRRKNAARVAVH